MILDKSGRPIKVGDYIVYVFGGGSSTNMRYGKVIALDSFQPYPPHPKLEYSISVQTVNNEDYMCRENPKLLKSISVLKMPNRMLIVEKHQIPMKVQTLLAKE
jgi:hypothetical protein